MWAQMSSVCISPGPSPPAAALADMITRSQFLEGRVGSKMDSESALRSARVLLSPVQAPLTAPWPDAGPESLKSHCCGQVICTDIKAKVYTLRRGRFGNPRSRIGETIQVKQLGGFPAWQASLVSNASEPGERSRVSDFRSYLFFLSCGSKQAGLDLIGLSKCDFPEDNVSSRCGSDDRTGSASVQRVRSERRISKE
ncbi:hypothetical protein PoB_000291900 [Plakobranchus ocellatus]|uniref:Uncharacterized protein n=1 Tax=Plakobranchus ocellatus TaxID=259542 RepID=A0AAV3Y2E3_9GAST|nr:hypothetical protein PoB_000291900 [Plakobranchus ocellatus]